MKTTEQLIEVVEQARKFVLLHKLPVWIVPNTYCYSLSSTRPTPYSIPEGFSAILYDINMKAVDEVISARK